MKTVRGSKLISIILAGIMILGMTGCQMSASSTRPAKLEEVKEVINEIDSLENFTARLSIGIEADTNAEAEEVGPKLIQLIDLDMGSLQDLMPNETLVNGTLMSCDIKMDKDNNRAEVDMQAGELSVPIIYDGNVGYIGTDAFLTLLGIGDSNTELSTEEKAMIDLTFGRYKYIKAKDVDMSDISSITDLGLESENKVGNNAKIQVSKHKDKDTGTEIVYTMQANKETVQEKLAEAGLSDDIVLAGKDISVKMLVKKQVESKVYEIKFIISADKVSFITSLKYIGETPNISIPSSSEIMDPENMLGGFNSGFELNEADKDTENNIDFTDDNSLSNSVNYDAIDVIMSKIGTLDYKEDEYVTYSGKIKLVNSKIYDEYSNLSTIEGNLNSKTFKEYSARVEEALSKTSMKEIVPTFNEGDSSAYINAYSKNDLDSQVGLYVTPDNYASASYSALVNTKEDIETVVNDIKNIIGAEISEETLESVIKACNASEFDGFAVYLDDKDNDVSLQVSNYGYTKDNPEIYIDIRITIVK